VSKDKFDLSRVSPETLDEYLRLLMTSEVLAEWDGGCSEGLQAVIDEARVPPPPPKTLREILDEGLCVGLDAEDCQVLIQRAREALKRQERRDSMVADVVKAASYYTLWRGRPDGAAASRLVRASVRLDEFDEENGGEQ
jgi:hypothetical protein